MKRLGCVLSVVSSLLIAACNASSGSGAGTSPTDRVPMGPEPGSPAAQSPSGTSSAGPSAGMPGTY
jgi:hypothetical protein